MQQFDHQRLPKHIMETDSTQKNSRGTHKGKRIIKKVSGTEIPEKDSETAAETKTAAVRAQTFFKIGLIGRA
jgi:hypothetical protein